MYEDFKKQFNVNQKALRSLLKKKDSFKQAIDLCLEQHALVHPKLDIAYNSTLFDLVLHNLNDDCYRNLQDKENRTILFYIWHTTRIEDITMNILVNNKNQVFTEGNCQEKINSSFTATGNAMTSDEILRFSTQINIDELLKYRLEVAKKTRDTILGFKPEDLKRKFAVEQNERILNEKAVLKNKKSIWLIDFWGKKNVAGILLMPITRHHFVHINAMMRLKKKCDKLIK